MKDTVGDWMSPETATVSPRSSIGEALAQMRGHGVRHLCVLEGGHLVGILSERDITRVWPSALKEDGGGPSARSFQSMLVRHVMTQPPVVTGPQVRVGVVAGQMTKLRIGALPVVDAQLAGRLIGLITQADCARALAPRESLAHTRAA